MSQILQYFNGTKNGNIAFTDITIFIIYFFNYLEHPDTGYCKTNGQAFVSPVFLIIHHHILW